MEYDWLFLAEAYNYTYEAIMAMPCSRRHKQVKFRQEVVSQRNARNGAGIGGGPGLHHSWVQQAAQVSRQG